MEKFGWRMLPRGHHGNIRMLEWVKFDDHVVCDGKRVYRELQLHSDFSIRLYVMNRLVATPIGDVIPASLRAPNKILQVFKFNFFIFCFCYKVFDGSNIKKNL